MNGWMESETKDGGMEIKSQESIMVDGVSSCEKFKIRKERWMDEWKNELNGNE